MGDSCVGKIMTQPFTLRPYQIKLSQQGVSILQRLRIVYLAMEVRTGKTLTALEIARLYGAKNVLFLTKKKAIASIESDYEKLAPDYALTVINDESMHKLEGSFDLVIHDEHHRFGAIPKPGQSTKLFKQLFAKLPHIYLSGTPTPESYSQIYHQFWVSAANPFAEKSFYAWARSFVSVKQKRIPSGFINDYSDANIDAIAPLIEPYMIRYSQEDAGFVSQIDEEICWVSASDRTHNLAKRLINDRFVQGTQGTCTADTAAALQQKLHQIYSGTLILDEEPEMPRKSVVLDNHKARFILDKFVDCKLVIFYKFTQEGRLIAEAMGDRVTTDLDEFNASNKSIALQIVSGREGLNLSAAEAIVFFNIDFSATSYWQARDRMTTRTRRESKIYWLFTVGGIEEKVYAAVQDKKSYTTSIFKKDFGIKPKRVIDPVKAYQAV
ncbi:MAG TPA: DEAD/DEAH box helicase family protein [Coleofasciculaceae cyanobacterium]